MKRLTWYYIRLMLLIGGGLISLSTPRFTQPLGPPTGLPPENLFATLGLDEDTQAEIRTIKTTSRAELRKLLPQLQQAHQRMNALLDQDTPEEATVMEQIETMATIQMKIKQERLRTMLRVRTLLSPAQRTALRKKMRTRPRFGHPGRRRGGPAAFPQRVSASRKSLKSLKSQNSLRLRSIFVRPLSLSLITHRLLQYPFKYPW